MTAEYAVGHYTSRLTAINHWLGDAGRAGRGAVGRADRPRRARPARRLTPAAPGSVATRSPCWPWSTTARIAEPAVEGVRDRVRLVGEQADPRSPSTSTLEDGRPRWRGVPAAALRGRGVDRADPGDPKHRRIRPGEVHGHAVTGLPTPTRPSPDAREHRRPGRARPDVRLGATGLLGGVAAEGVVPASARSDLVLPAGAGTPGPGCGGSTQPAELVQPGPLGDPGTAAGQPGGLGRAAPRRPAAPRSRRRPPRRARAARAASSAGRCPCGHRSRNSGYGANGAVRIAGSHHPAAVVAHDQPPVGRRGEPAAAPPVALEPVAATVADDGRLDRARSEQPDPTGSRNSAGVTRNSSAALHAREASERGPTAGTGFRRRPRPPVTFRP